MNGDQSRGLELIGIVRTHSAFIRDDADEIDRILGRAGLRPDVVAAAVAKGGGQNLAAAVDELIDELATDADV